MTTAPHAPAGASAVLKTVLAYGPIARGDIARHSGLSPSGVTRVSARLAELGLVNQWQHVSRQRVAGRPQIPIDIATGTHVAFGVHVAHSFATLSAVDLRGRVLAQRRIDHTDTDPYRVLTSIAREFAPFQREFDDRVHIGLGVAVGGWVDAGSGVIVEHASLKWYDVAARNILSEATGLPVRVDSHARALAAAERLFGAGQRAESVVHLFVGNVVDAAILTDGGPYLGRRSAAGTVAHLPFGDPARRCSCGRYGCFESAVADWAVAPGSESIVDVVEAAASGQAEARDVLLQRARTVGRAAALLCDVINPEVLVVTEAAIARIPACLDALRDAVAEHSHICRDPSESVLPSSFPTSEVLGVAAGAVQLDALFSDPFSLHHNEKRRVP